MRPAETNGGWKKYGGNPVLGGALGTCFDIAVLKDGTLFRMWFSWRPKKSIAYAESTDGMHWSDPVTVLSPASTFWEEDINRPSVLKHDGRYHMWYTGQAKGKNSWIGYATSSDGITWKRMSDKPVLSFEELWEQVAVMCPHVLRDNDTGMYRMWYSGGEQYEPNAVGYATSTDGISWTKHTANPVFTPNPAIPWEQERVAGCQVEKHGGWYYMFYIGYADVHSAAIGIARSKDGITGWERHQANPVLAPGKNTWDGDACYKPYAILDGNRWLLWYNGRLQHVEQIGLAEHTGADLGFKV